MSAFVREPRYIVAKVTDAEKALTATEVHILTTLVAKVAAYRRCQDKVNLSGVFVEHDWPEHDMVWAAIEKRMAT